MASFIRGAWPQVLLTVVGLWLMAAPAVLGYEGRPEDVDRLVGPLVVSVGAVACAGAVRGFRWLALPLALCEVVAPFVWSYDLAPAANAVVSGALIGVLGAVRGRVEDTYGGGWRALFGSRPRGDSGWQGGTR